MPNTGTGLIIRPLGAIAQAMANLFQAPPNDIRGVSNSDWFGPGQPVHPIAPEGTEPRGIQYLPMQNMSYTPRADAAYSGARLRESSFYDLARVIIENVKDQICRTPINIRLKRKPGESSKDYAKRKPDQKIIDDIDALFAWPNPENNWSEFVRKITDDMLVGDFASILFRTTKSRELVELRAIDGASIVRYIDEQGYTPQPPSPAYAQVWGPGGMFGADGGIPMVDLTTDQLLYVPRNVLTYRIYGLSPLEQAINWINIGINRLQFQGNYYTTGVIPDAIQVVPPGAAGGPDKMKEAMDFLNSELAGQLAKRRQWRLVQGFSQDGKDQILFPKEKLLTDPFDELIIRCLCFAFGTSPQRLMRMMGTRNAGEQQDAAEKEGLEPWLDWLSGSVCNRIIQQKLGFLEYEATAEQDTEVDPSKQAAIDKSDVDAGIRTRNEAREDRGLAPRPEPEADQLAVTTATGVAPLSADEHADRTKQLAEAAASGNVLNESQSGAGKDKVPGGSDKQSGGSSAGGGSDKSGSSADKAARHKGKGYSESHVHHAHQARPAIKVLVKKGKQIKIESGRLLPASRTAKAHIQSELTQVFRRQRDVAADEAARLLKEIGYTGKVKSN